MKNIIDYVTEEIAGFDEKPFCDVDSLVLSQLSYLKLGCIAAGSERPAALPEIHNLHASELYPALLKGVRAAGLNRRLICELAANPRFRNIKIFNCAESFSPDDEKQFAAVTFILPDGSLYLAYRGTDSTMIGWKEDFNMAFKCPVPSQVEGAEYLRRTAEAIPGKIRVGGHSKGGNVAVYAAMSAQPKIKERLTAVYSHDGPGFLEETIQSENFRGIEPLIHKTLPQSSLIGMLLEHHENYSIVESDGFWIAQHDPFLWSVEKGEFVLCEQISGGARYFNDTLNSWVKAQTDDKRELFVDTLFQVLNSTSAETTGELSDGFVRNLPTVLGAVKNIDADTRRAVSHILRELFSAAFRNLVPSRREKEADAPTSPDA